MKYIDNYEIFLEKLSTGIGFNFLLEKKLTDSQYDKLYTELKDKIGVDRFELLKNMFNEIYSNHMPDTAHIEKKDLLYSSEIRYHLLNLYIKYFNGKPYDFIKYYKAVEDLIFMLSEDRRWKNRYFVFYPTYKWVYYFKKNNIYYSELDRLYSDGKRFFGIYKRFKSIDLLSVLFKGSFKNNLVYFKDQFEKLYSINGHENLPYDLKILDAISMGKINLYDYKSYDDILVALGFKEFKMDIIEKYFNEEIVDKFKDIIDNDFVSSGDILELYREFRKRKIGDKSFVIICRFMLNMNGVDPQFDFRLSKMKSILDEKERMFNWVEKYYDLLPRNYWEYNNVEELGDDIRVVIDNNRLSSIINNMSKNSVNVYNIASSSDKIFIDSYLMQLMYKETNWDDNIFDLNLMSKNSLYMNDDIQAFLKKSAMYKSIDIMKEMVKKISGEDLDYENMLVEFKKLEKQKKLTFKYSDGRFIVVSFKDYETHRRFAKQSSWCTAYSKDIGGDDNFRIYSLNGFTFTIYDTKIPLSDKESMLQITFEDISLSEDSIPNGASQDRYDNSFDIVNYLNGIGLKKEKVFYLVALDYEVFIENIVLDNFIQKSDWSNKKDIIGLINKYPSNYQLETFFDMVKRIFKNKSLIKMYEKDYLEDLFYFVYNYLDKKLVTKYLLNDEDGKIADSNMKDLKFN